ncbi:unnamed protein product [Lampetra fluviatilis]
MARAPSASPTPRDERTPRQRRPPPLPKLLLLLAWTCCCCSCCWGCQLPQDWRPQSEACRAELAEIIVMAKVLALHQDSYGVHNLLPWQGGGGDSSELLYAAEVELLCDQAWGSMLEMPAGARFNVTGLGYFSCHSYTVMENNTYFLFLRMDENYHLVPHGVNFQDAIFPETQDTRRMFSSLFQFSNCSQGAQVHLYSPEWEMQQDNEMLCAPIQSALLEEEDRVRKLTKQLSVLEKKNRHLQQKASGRRSRVKKLKRVLRQAKKDGKQAAEGYRRLLGKGSGSGGWEEGGGGGGVAGGGGGGLRAPPPPPPPRGQATAQKRARLNAIPFRA